MKTHVFMFSRRFADAVRAGVKRQTIRPPRCRLPRLGDLIDARAWTGAPYRSKQERLSLGVIVSVRAVLMDAPSECVILGESLTMEHVDRIATDDGFDDADALFDWFSHTHGLPFFGHIYNWVTVRGERGAAFLL